MSESHDDSLALRRRWRNRARDLSVVILMLLVWWYGYHWTERRFAIDDDLACFGGLYIVAAAVFLVVKALGLDAPRRDDPQQRRRHRLVEQDHERRRDRFRWAWVMVLGMLLLSRLPLLLGAAPEPHPGHPAENAWAVVLISMLFLNATRLGLPMRSAAAAAADVAGLSRQLLAMRFGFATLLLLGMAALLLDGYHPGTLPRTLPVVLLLGLLAYQLTLAIRKPVVGPTNEP